MTSGDEMEQAKRPTSAPAEDPTLDDLLRMIQETHVETEGLHASMADLTALVVSSKVSADAVKDNLQSFINLMTQVNQRQNEIEDRLTKVEDWQRRRGVDTLVPTGADG